MRVILVRHAIAEERDESRWPDAERPLSERGRKRFRAVARGLGIAVPPVGVVLSSPYARAWQTAALLHDFARWPLPQPCDAIIEANPDAIGSALAESTESVALVGHEPGLSALTSWLLGAQPTASLAFRKGGAACIEVERWEAGASALLWFAPPSLLRRQRRAAR